MVHCPDSEFSLWQIFYSTVRGLTKFKTRWSLSDGYDGQLGQFIEPLIRPGVKLDEKMSSITIFKIP